MKCSGRRKKTPAAPAYGCGRQETAQVGLQSQTGRLERDGHGARTVDCGLPSLQVIRHRLPGVKRFQEEPSGSALPGGQTEVAANCDTSVPSPRQPGAGVIWTERVIARDRTRRRRGWVAPVKRRRPRGVSDGHYCAAHPAGSQELYFEKSTLGACAAPGDSSSKYGRGPLPRTLAVSTCGKRRI